MPTLQEIRRNAAAITRDAQVSAVSFTMLFMLISLVLNLADLLGVLYLPQAGSNFVYFVIFLLNPVLSAGFIMYCMRIYRRERVEYADLFDGFSFVGKVLGLYFLMAFFIALWSLLFVFPAIFAAYRYRFAVYNLYEDPSISPLEALRRSKRQTVGYKMHLFRLDLSFLGWLLISYLPSNLIHMLESSGVFAMNDFLQLFLVWAITAGAGLCYLARYYVCQYTYYDLARAACASPEPPMIEQ